MPTFYAGNYNDIIKDMYDTAPAGDSKPLEVADLVESSSESESEELCE